ncbi:hypothetical protein LZ30DRAFT_468347 [Colletotrichum cereale]|nr:hypothetical protein LZ30DRAFT_468347 [Colletotrichum cereale]
MVVALPSLLPPVPFCQGRYFTFALLGGRQGRSACRQLQPSSIPPPRTVVSSHLVAMLGIGPSPPGDCGRRSTRGRGTNASIHRCLFTCLAGVAWFVRSPTDKNSQAETRFPFPGGCLTPPITYKSDRLGRPFSPSSTLVSGGHSLDFFLLHND